MVDDSTWLLNALESISNFVDEHELAHVRKELIAAKKAAHGEMGTLASFDPIVMDLYQEMFRSFHRAPH